MSETLKLEFESGVFLHSLLGGEEKSLAYLQEKLSLAKVVTRDAWVLLEGEAEALELARKVFEDLEEARRGGALLTVRDFKLAVDMVASASDQSVTKMVGIKLLGARGGKAVVPKSPGQAEYISAMQSHDVTFGLGPAGTGKTYLAMAMALSMLKAKLIHRVVLTRPAVEAGEALGFLPGDLKEKVAPYLRPLYDAMYDMLGPEEGQKLLEDGTIEIAPLAYMRGRTLARSFVILDEAQNTTPEQMFMFLTRLGEGSRCVVTGDSSQVDLKDGQLSGLAEAERALKAVEGIALVTLSGEDVVRHEVVGRIIAAYDRARA
ncbi:PhoH family protein [Roseibacillus persicicus]|uniref:PhoH family protein n=1 Tax=Roseibacillus persicicus TaxID=454148 RepID=UPI00280FE205|nr:PhoH family protein [Roseibacillus persicicus]MDQ8189420.1 PhoH family protein [Roseibacillus persicicus]